MWQRRRIVLQCHARRRDIGGFFGDIRERISREVDLLLGYHVAFAGQFEHLERAGRLLMPVVPTSLLLVVFLLYLSMSSVRGIPFTVSAGVGFVAVSAVGAEVQRPLATLVVLPAIYRRFGGR